MTKKHFISIARIIKEQTKRTGSTHSWKLAQYATAKSLADYFQSENPNFDRLRFLSACGVK